MSYIEFKKQHDILITKIIFTSNNRADTLVERLERLRLDNEKHFNQLWGEL